MADIILTVPAGILNRVLDAIAGNNNWTPADGTKAVFAKAWLVKQAKEQVRVFEANSAGAAAKTAASAVVDAEILIT